VPEARDDLGEQLEPVTPLVRDEDTQMLNLVLNHPDQEMYRGYGGGHEWR